jgi:adenylate cyclase class 2
MIEHELKIPVARLDDVRTLLRELGASRLHPRLRESNLLFDTDDGLLATTRRVLRLRCVETHNVLTYKGPATFRGAIKSRREIELDIGSAESMIDLLAALGYTPTIRYEKEREGWRMRDVRVDLDHTPMGEFIELEGPPDELEAVARALSLDPESAVTGSYVDLWLTRRQRHPELNLARDMVFDS